MSHPTEQATLQPPASPVIVPKRKKMKVQEGLDLILDLAAGQDGKHKTREKRNEALDNLKTDFGIEECEVQALLMTARRGDPGSVRASLERRRQKGVPRNKAQLS